MTDLSTRREVIDMDNNLPSKEKVENDFKRDVSAIFNSQFPGSEYDEESGIITIPKETVKSLREKRSEKDTG